MSTPISVCQVIKATNGDQAMFDHLVEAMDYNLSRGAFTIFPCKHEPRCERPSEEDIEKFHVRLMGAIEERRKKARAKAPQRPHGDFSKWVFPVIKSMKWDKTKAKDFIDAQDLSRRPKHD